MATIFLSYKGEDEDLAQRLGRPVPEEEVLIWLALGAAAQREGRALLRPVLLSRASHRFMEGRVRRAAFSDGFSSRIYDVSSTPDDHRPPTAPGARPGSPPELGS